MKLITIVTAEVLINYKKNDTFGQWMENVRNGLKSGVYKIKRHYTNLGESKNSVEIWK